MNHRDFYPACAFTKLHLVTSKREFITEQTLVFPQHLLWASGLLTAYSLITVYSDTDYYTIVF